MSAILLLAVAAVPPLQAASETGHRHPDIESLSFQDGARPLHMVSEDVRQTLRSEASAKTEAKHRTAVLRLIALYREISGDGRRNHCETLETLQRRVRLRLRAVKKRLERRLARRPVAAGRRQIAEPAGRDGDYASATAALAGPSAHVGRGGGGLAQPDNGAALVELIEQTISPQIWDVNGGPATVVYYAPQHALVVRAPYGTHGRVGALLRGLRRANR